MIVFEKIGIRHFLQYEIYNIANNIYILRFQLSIVRAAILNSHWKSFVIIVVKIVTLSRFFELSKFHGRFMEWRDVQPFLLLLR